jgi:ketosteroid isomerase-like protein
MIIPPGIDPERGCPRHGEHFPKRLSLRDTARAMSQENVEVMRRWAEAIARGDLEEALWAPDLEIVNAEGWALEATYRGYEGLRRWWDDLEEAFSDFAMQVEEITPIDGERFLTEQRFIGHFRQTGIRFDALWASVVTVKDGRITSAVGYLSKRRALKAVGPPAQDARADS